MGFFDAVELGMSGIEKLFKKIYQNKLYVGLMLVALFFWEHYFRLWENSFRPTIGVNHLTTTFGPIFRSIGTYIAYLSSFLIIDIEQLKITFGDLVFSLIKFFFSWIELPEGYFETAKTYKDIAGTLENIGWFVLFFVILYVLYLTVVGLIYMAYDIYVISCELDEEIMFQEKVIEILNNSAQKNKNNSDHFYPGRQ